MKQGTKISPEYKNATESRPDPGNEKSRPKYSDLEGGTKNRGREMGGTTVSEKWGESDKGGVRGKNEVAVEEEEKSSKHTVSCD